MTKEDYKEVEQMQDQILAKEEVKGWICKFDELATEEAKANDAVKQAVFAIGKALIQAKSELANIKHGFYVAVQKSKLSYSSAMNYMRVAESEVLNNPDVFPELPNAIGPLIDLAAWKPEDVKKAVEHASIRPTSTRRELKRTHAFMTGEQKPEPKGYVTVIEIQVDASRWSQEDQYQLSRNLQDGFDTQGGLLKIKERAMSWTKDDAYGRKQEPKIPLLPPPSANAA